MLIDLLTFTCNWLMIFKFCLTSLKFIVINVHLSQNHFIVIRFLKNEIISSMPNHQYLYSQLALLTKSPFFLISP